MRLDLRDPRAKRDRKDQWGRLDLSGRSAQQERRAPRVSRGSQALPGLPEHKDHRVLRE